MKENLLIAEALGGEVRIHAADTTALVEEARRLHAMWPTSCAALGRTLTVTGLMASDLKKEDERITVTMNGHGPAGMIVAQGNGRGEVRGFIDNPGVYMVNEKTGKLAVGQAVGTSGTLQVTRDLRMGQPFTGVVALQSGEIGDDFAYYFAASEQVNSVVAVGVLIDTDQSVRAAGGLIAQLLPEASEQTISRLEAITAGMRPISSYIDEGKTPEQIIRLLFDDACILERKSVTWHCGCSKEHFAEALALVEPGEIQAMISEDHRAEVVCQYCGRAYQFSEEELQDVLARQRHMEDRKRLDS